MTKCKGSLKNVFVVVLLLGVFGARAARVKLMQSRAGPAESSIDVGGDQIPLEPAAVAPYLDSYGFSAAGAETWRVSPGGEDGPQVDLQVTGHSESGGHTWYTVECALNLFGSGRMAWSTSRRLSQLREMHAQVNAELGASYAKLFAGAPFAMKGGLPGTTARLSTWCAALSKCVNTGGAPPSLVASVLRFFEAPEPETKEPKHTNPFEEDSPVGDDHFPGGALAGNPFGADSPVNDDATNPFGDDGGTSAVSEDHVPPNPFAHEVDEAAEAQSQGSSPFVGNPFGEEVGTSAVGEEHVPPNPFADEVDEAEGVQSRGSNPFGDVVQGSTVQESAKPHNPFDVDLPTNQLNPFDDDLPQVPPGSSVSNVKQEINASSLTWCDPKTASRIAMEEFHSKFPGQKHQVRAQAPVSTRCIEGVALMCCPKQAKSPEDCDKLTKIFKEAAKGAQDVKAQRDTVQDDGQLVYIPAGKLRGIWSPQDFTINTKESGCPANRGAHEGQLESIEFESKATSEDALTYLLKKRVGFTRKKRDKVRIKKDPDYCWQHADHKQCTDKKRCSRQCLLVTK